MYNSHKWYGRVLSAALLLALPLADKASAADRYNVSLTRKDKDLYKVDNTAFWVQTRYCYNYAYGEDASLDRDKVVFLDSAEKCDVKRVFKESGISAGTYEVSISRESDNLYSTLEGVFVRTSMCLSLALADDALLRLNGYGGGTVIFIDDRDTCDVQGVFSEARL